MTTRKDNQATHTPTRPTGTAVTALVALLTMVACQTVGAPPQPTMTTSPYTQFRELMKRPDINQITQQYDAMATTIRQRLVTEIGLPGWTEDPDSDSSAGCGSDFS